jgi:ubiquinone/menaquinone biosynthesis C-methylase UbiE
MSIKFNRKFAEPERMPWLIAFFYDLLPARMLQPTYQQIAQSLPLKNKGFLLDIGAGPGHLTQLIAQKYPKLKVIGIDSSATMVEIAKKRRKELANLEFKIMDGKNLEFNQNSIDYVISTLAFHHWREPLKVLNKIYRILKKGSQAFIFDIYSEFSDEEMDKSLAYPWGIKIFKRFIKKMLSVHGFTSKEYENEVCHLIVKSHFKKATFERAGIVMRIELKK